MIIGTGRELSALSRLLCLSHSADVAVKDGTAGNQVLAALRKLADPSNTAKSKARPGKTLVNVEWQPALPWRLHTVRAVAAEGERCTHVCAAVSIEAGDACGARQAGRRAVRRWRGRRVRRCC